MYIQLIDKNENTFNLPEHFKFSSFNLDFASSIKKQCFSNLSKQSGDLSINPRSFSIEGKADPSLSSNLHLWVNNLLSFIQAGQPCRLKIAESDESRYLSGIYLKQYSKNDLIFSKSAKITLNFEVENPFWISEDLREYSFENVSNNDEFTLDCDSSFITPSIIYVTALENISALKIITQSPNYNFFSFAYQDFNTGDEIVIDSEQGMVYNNSTNKNLNKYLSGAFPELYYGENLFLIKSDGALNLRVCFNKRELF